MHKPISLRKVVVAYSGGLDTSVMLRWIKKTYACETIAFCADVGQKEDLSKLAQKALATGADHFVHADLREDFVKNAVFFALKAQAVYEGSYLLGTALARPIIAAQQVKIALQYAADAVAHGATGKGNDQLRFELAFSALAPQLTVLAPWRIWEFKGREDLIAFAKQENIPIEQTIRKPYSIDRNLMHVSYEGGLLEDPWLEPPKEMFELTQDPEHTEEPPQEMTVGFVAGEAVSIDSIPFTPVALLEKMNAIGGKHGIGRIDIVENRAIGIKARGIYETPGATILKAAHRALESITLDREVMHLRDSLGVKIAHCIYNGLWFSPEFTALKKLIEDIQQPVSGEVRLRLARGNITICGRRAHASLYNPELASFDTSAGFDHHDAGGFIKLTGLRLKSWGRELAGVAS